MYNNWIVFIVIIKSVVFNDFNLFLFFVFGIDEFMFVFIGVFVIVIGFLMFFFMLFYLCFNGFDNVYFFVVVLVKDFVINNWGCVLDV